MSANNKSLVGRPAPSTRLQQSFIEGSQRVTHSRMMRKTGKGKGADLDALKQEIEMDEHIIDVEELCERLNTHQTDGLTTSKAAEKLARDGPNKLTPPTGTPTWKKLAKHLFGGFSALLWIAAILAFITYAVSPSVAEDNLYIGIVVVIVIVGTGIFSYMQEAKSLALMKNFANMIPDSATVVRGGMKKTVNSEDLVVGDLVEVSMGNKTPADIRLISTAGLKVDNSSLTGESEPQSRVAQMTDENPMESKNIMFYSTPVLEGSGMGIVLRTGDETLIGRIAALATGTKNVKTPIAREIEHLVKVIATIACTTGLIFLIVGLSKFGVGSLDQVVKSILFAIGIIIASVPEGLLATMTVALTLTAKRMAAKNVLVKNLESVETLGSTTTICSDKTGTLTQNRMTVAHIWMDKKIYSANSPVEEHGFSRDAPSFKMFNQVAAICNTANFDPEDMDTPVKERACIGGNATDYAILKFSHVNEDIDAHRDKFPMVASMPFNSTTKWQMSVNWDDELHKNILHMKGAPERVLATCSHILVDGKPVSLKKRHKKAYDKAYVSLAGGGERVIGLAYKELSTKQYPKDCEFELDDSEKFPVEKLVFAGLVSIIDPPREAVPGAIKQCQSAHIKVIMVTGDHPLTAKAIAKQVGIIQSETRDEMAERLGVKEDEVDPEDVKAIVVTGSALSEMSDEELDEVLSHQEIVFARTSPQQKLRIVEGCQKRGDIVAVTGDGVNDSPALKKADIGIAMGITGTDVSKEAADMLLLDDNFASIVHGVEQGRTIFDNLKKSISYKLTANVPESIPFLLYVILDMPLMLSTVLILLIDVGTDMWPAIALAYEMPEPDIMDRHPRNAKKDKIINPRLLVFSYLIIGFAQSLAGIFAFIVIASESNGSHGYPNGFPPSALPGLGSQFIPNADKNYDVCRVTTGLQWDPSTNSTTYVSGERYFIGCASNATQLDAITPDQFKTLNSTEAIRHGILSDNCFNEEHMSNNPTCALSGAMTREHMLGAGQTGYFWAIILCQWFVLFLSKTRIASLFQHGIHNVPLVLGWIFENILAACIIFIPPLNIALATYPLHWTWFFPALPFALLIFGYDEVRKALVRRKRGGWVERHTSY